jgi:hypothetical protein
MTRQYKHQARLFDEELDEIEDDEDDPEDPPNYKEEVALTVKLYFKEIGPLGSDLMPRKKNKNVCKI